MWNSEIESEMEWHLLNLLYQLSCHSEKITRYEFDVSHCYQKKQNKMKAMSNELSLQLQLVRENLDRILKEKISIK